MAIILNIETATGVCSVAIGSAGDCVALVENNNGNQHATVLPSLIEQALRQANCELINIDAVAISMGPGSYTGLRVGLSTAKGICFALNKPLIAIPTLEAMAMGMKQQHPKKNLLYCPMIDARRMEVYTCILNNEMEYFLETTPKVIDATSFETALSNYQICFGGNGVKKISEIIKHDKALFDLNNNYHSAKNMCSLAQTHFANKHFADMAYCEPIYLKQFGEK
jgi:tRNA threonylcarbamoyladenosine biosynthesis protein TsaB